MTNEEAKNLIDRWVVITLIEGGVSLSERTRQALDMAIKALEHCGDAISRDAVLDACSQSYGILDAMGRIEELPSVNPKPCEDAISRHAAIETIDGWLKCNDYNNAERHIMRAMQSVLYDLPPVTPKQRTGHWISASYGYYCSECDQYYPCKSYWDYEFHYCPNCGAKMEEQA